MLIAGIDIGSRSIELVALNGKGVAYRARTATTFDPLGQARRVLADAPGRIDLLVATGYGRGLVESADLGLPVRTLTEIKAYGLGAHSLHPEARTVLDIGGQDTKAISLLPGGRVGRFEMNDRCAAGTGKFLEFMATAFQVPVEAFGAFACRGGGDVQIGSMCTVFAETEATSLMAKGERPENIALALHRAVVKRTVGMLGRVGLEFPLLFAGGVAHNPCAVKLLREVVAGEVIVPGEPDMVGALGAALWGAQQEGAVSV
ncbi:acyl-CoA dehydratase activase [Desulfocurvibacter africanus]|uniref:CoA-substrate-specific enzyme activase n=1 Tax=Desulfocurvibacter africanus subsp. africanus str. Walvis Bay TaxID=690850 RepID=F3Z2A1_DESAF|nr:acyl-CoA dehydratase activase [Desulfocurvibacter africanus]EGJ50141.1 CoA-substrate-specific enzyme activase [Desulfocurvibacter africanus subsp. africanus str. Walvis Bay]